MKLLGDNPYWEVAKYAFAIAGGATLAGGLVAGGFKVAKKGMNAIFGESEPQKKEEEEEKTENEPTNQASDDELTLSDDDDDINFVE